MNDDLQLLVDLYKRNPRQGPGSDAATRRALDLSGLLGRSDLSVADLGCGSGASTLVLAEALDAHVTAVDLVPEFLAALERAADDRGVRARITSLATSFEALPFAAESLDAIWSEGAIYNLGFEAGVEAWSRYLAPGGVLGVSELTWLTSQRPEEIEAHWNAQYPEVGTASAKLAALERKGLSPVGYFVLPESCWLEHYYRPLERCFPSFLAAHGHSAAARALVEAEAREIDLYERFREYVGYGFYLARKR